MAMHKHCWFLLLGQLRAVRTQKQNPEKCFVTVITPMTSRRIITIHRHVYQYERLTFSSRYNQHRRYTKECSCFQDGYRFGIPAYAQKWQPAELTCNRRKHARQQHNSSAELPHFLTSSRVTRQCVSLLFHRRNKFQLPCLLPLLITKESTTARINSCQMSISVLSIPPASARHTNSHKPRCLHWETLHSTKALRKILRGMYDSLLFTTTLTPHCRTLKTCTHSETIPPTPTSSANIH